MGSKDAMWPKRPKSWKGRHMGGASNMEHHPKKKPSTREGFRKCCVIELNA